METITMRYLEKPIETRYGASASMWIINRISISTGKTATAYVRLEGYNNLDSYLNNKPSLEAKNIVIDNVEDILITTVEAPDTSIYDLVSTTVFERVLLSDAFVGAEVKTFEIEE